MIKHNSLLGQQLFRKQAILRATVMQDTHNEKAGGKLTKRLSALFFICLFCQKLPEAGCRTGYIRPTD